MGDHAKKTYLPSPEFESQRKRSRTAMRFNGEVRAFIEQTTFSKTVKQNCDRPEKILRLLVEFAKFEFATCCGNMEVSWKDAQFRKSHYVYKSSLNKDGDFELHKEDQILQNTNRCLKCTKWLN